MASRAPVDQGVLSDLVERRIEAPNVEYKNWMPLTTNLERAKIARHICALSNFGGGYLVFGFDDDGTPSEPYSGNLSAYSQDAINSIGERYLAPQPHCTLHRVTAQSGREYPVIRVPSHGEVPVCAKADGPHEKGKPQGILSGVHYIREPGPRSVPINSPALWREVIRRCVFSERGALLSSIGQLFDGSHQEVKESALFDQWIADALRRWGELIAVWPMPIIENRCAFVFRLLTADGEAPAPLELNDLQKAIREASFAASEKIGDGAPFDIGWDGRGSVALPLGREAYEGQQLPSEDDKYLLPILWRVSVDGLGVEITAIPEDNPWVQETVEERSSRKWPPGQRFTPSFQVATTVQHLVFVRELAKHYRDATNCELAVDIAGLTGREIADPNPGVYFSVTRRSQVDARRMRIAIGLAALDAELPEVTGSLIGPIFRLFAGSDIGADYVRALIERR